MTNWAPPTRIAIGTVCLVASFVMSVVTWVGLGDIAGYGVMRFVMPAVVDTYISCALITWLTVSDKHVAQLARRNTYASAAFGTLTQAVFHCALIWTATHSTWQASLAFICGGIPPAGAFASAHMIIRAARVTDGAHSTSAPTETVRQSQPEPPTRTIPTPTAIAPTVSAPSHGTDSRTTTEQQQMPASQLGRRPQTPAVATTSSVSAPSTVVPAPNPVTAAPAPSAQRSWAPTPPTAGRETTASGDGTEVQDLAERRATGGRRGVPKEMQERIYRMLKARNTYEQISRDCGVSMRTVSNYSARLREQEEIAAARNGIRRMVRR